MEAILHRIAEKYLNRLSATDQARINEAIDKLEQNPPKGDIQPVIGEPGKFRVTVGNHRILFRKTDSNILITHIDPRGQVYKKKNKGSKR